MDKIAEMFLEVRGHIANREKLKFKDDWLEEEKGRYTYFHNKFIWADTEEEMLDASNQQMKIRKEVEERIQREKKKVDIPFRRVREARGRF